MKVCVLQPDYSTSGVDYRHYDPPRDLSALLPGHTVDHVALHKLTTYRQLKTLAAEGYDIFVNLCEGYLDWDTPSIDVIDALERLDLPFTGPPSALYDPSKVLMKYVAHTVGVRTPRHALVTRASAREPLDLTGAGLSFPLFVKPAHAGDSLGIDAGSLVHDDGALRDRVALIVREHGSALVEEYIDGRELTVLVVASASPGDPPTALAPVEFRFPHDTAFKTYALKTADLHPDANVPVTDAALSARLKDAALRVFRGFGGAGYARMDFRLDGAGELYFLEANFTCSVFYSGGYEGSADYILQHDGIGQAGFAVRIIAEGMARHRAKQRPYAIRGDSIAGYGIVATRDIAAGEVVYRGEGRAQRLVTARHVEDTWSADDQAVFAQYGYPLSDEVYSIWDSDPAQWAPQNHSCDANTAFDGLNVVALRAIATGTELTLDYGAFTNHASAPFACRCGSSGCRGVVAGTPGNSVTARERIGRAGP
jgi:D-alanine-D-alanine ligase-like ATP-grasp enzyme